MRDAAVSRMRCGAVGRVEGGGLALGADEILELVDPAHVGVAVELAGEQHPRVVALAAPGGEQGSDRSPLGDGQRLEVGLGFLDQDIEVPDGPQPGRDLAQPLAVALRPLRAVPVPEDAPRRPHPARRDPHPVELLGIVAFARARLAGDHPGQVEAQHLPAGLGDVVAGQHARRLPDDEALTVAGGLGLRGGGSGRPRRCLRGRSVAAAGQFGR